MKKLSNKEAQTILVELMLCYLDHIVADFAKATILPEEVPFNGKLSYFIDWLYDVLAAYEGKDK